MVIAKIEVSSTNATVVWAKEIPKGLIGGKVQIEYTDEMWDSLNKTVVFRGAVTKDVWDNGNEIIIPADVLSRSGVNLYVGVYGTNVDNNLGIPTFWAKLGVIRDAADPNEDPISDPSLPIWERLLNRVPDWNAPPGSDNHILNRTHWSEIQPANNTFNGDMTGRYAVMLNEGYYLVKISDAILGAEDLIGATVVVNSEGEEFEMVITEDDVEDGSEIGIPAILAGEAIASVQRDFSLYGLTAEAGTYFMCVVVDGETVAYVKSLSALPNYKEVHHKLDERFINSAWLANYGKGTDVILQEADQAFWSSSPCTSETTFQFALENGKTYDVSWDGEIYRCNAGSASIEIFMVTYLGNASILDESLPITDEPFCIASISVLGYAMAAEIATTSEAESHRVGITLVGDVPNRIPKEFLPKEYTFPRDLYDNNPNKEELESAHLCLQNGGRVYAMYNNDRFVVLDLYYDWMDNSFHEICMANSQRIMIWHKEYGWTQYARDGFILWAPVSNPDGTYGKKFRFTVDKDGNLKSYAIDDSSIT